MLDEFRLSNACSFEERTSLSTSVCGSILSYYWPSSSNGHDSSHVDGRMISLAENAQCNLRTVEKALKLVFSFKSFTSSACAAELSSLLCRHFFRPCSENRTSTHWNVVRSEECFFLQIRKCPIEWHLIEQHIKTVDTCLTLPDCTEIINEEGNSSKETTVTPEEYSVNRTVPRASITGYKNSPASQSSHNELNVNSILQTCNPFIPELGTTNCKIPCPADDMVIETSFVTAYLQLSYITISVEYLCCLVVFYTWARERQLFRFPHIVMFITMLLNFIRVVLRSLPFFIGRSQLMCSSKEKLVWNVKHEGSEFCKIQGGMMHFLSLSLCFLFCFSIFNVLVAILTFSRDNFIKRHQMTTFALEMIVTFIVSGYTVGNVYYACSYSTDPFFAGWCLPSGHGKVFYTMTLPLQIFTICSMVMLSLIIRRITQVSP
jgi:uncharacterized membrane protein YwzB